MNLFIKPFILLIAITLIVVSINISLQAQISSGGTPHAFSTGKIVGSVHFEILPPQDNQALYINSRTKQPGNKVGPFIFGEKTEVDFSLSNSDNWEVLRNGDYLWTLGIESPNAYSLNLVFDNFYLPEGAELFIYNKAKTQFLGAFTSRNNKESGSFATDLLEGDAIIIEYYEPESVHGDGTFTITNVTHGFVDLKSISKAFGGSQNCEINVSCPEGDGWESEISSVALIMVGSQGFCTGTLLNNELEDGTPYLLTAEHCIAGHEPLEDWIFRFNFDSPECITQNITTTQSLAGAQLRASNIETDFILLELDDTPPESYNVAYSGWSRDDVTGNTTCIHHPNADVKKISKDFDIPTQTEQLNVDNNEMLDVWRVVWEEGTTEGGSSGSPLFNSNHQVVGQLFGGAASCSNMLGSDFYGRFGVSWNNGTSDATILQPWLAPNNANLTEISTYDPTVAAIELDASLFDLLDNNQDIICKDSVQFHITLKNNGTINLNSLDIYYQLNEEDIDTLQWEGDLSASSLEQIEFPYLIAGDNPTFTVYSSNPNGQTDLNTSNDTITNSFVVADSVGYVILSLQTDNYGEETSWQIVNKEGNVVYSESDLASNKLHVSTLCLGEDCYQFEIFDSEEDGICCDFGTGSFNLVANNGDVLITNNTFIEASQSAYFCMPMYGDETTVGVSTVVEKDQLIISVNEDEQIQRIELFNLTGQQLYYSSYAIGEQRVIIPMVSYNNKVLLARVTTNREMTTQKILILY
ncbi:MAG: trypsin-like peptidase domain-containing protein [Flavobacteriales bacterium]|nr:trypsin-like peptidase domain-containing protein [Flavobacteriales bacterium]